MWHTKFQFHTPLSVANWQFLITHFVSRYDGKLAEFYWDGKTVTPALYGYDNHTSYHTELFQDTDQYRILPALSSMLGNEYNITARSWPISIVLYRLALAAENRHGTDALMESTQHRNRRSLERVSEIICIRIQF